MIVLIKWILFSVLAISLWSICIYISVKIKQDNVYSSYKLMDILLQKRYSLISAILSKVQSQMTKESSDILYATQLRDEAMTLGIKRENLARRFAFDYELSLTMQKIIEKIKDYPQLNSSQELTGTLTAYIELNNKIKIHASAYNKKAESLRHAIDTFPSSFISRLNNVKRAHYFKV